MEILISRLQLSSQPCQVEFTAKLGPTALKDPKVGVSNVMVSVAATAYQDGAANEP